MKDRRRSNVRHKQKCPLSMKERRRTYVRHEIREHVSTTRKIINFFFLHNDSLIYLSQFVRDKFWIIFTEELQSIRPQGLLFLRYALCFFAQYALRI